MKTKQFRALAVILSVLVLFIACKKDDNNDTYTETEQNNSFATANDIIVGETYDAQISPAQDVDYFKVSSSSNLSITLDGDSNLELYINIYDENQVNIYGGDTGSRGASLTHSIGSDEYNGNIYIVIESAYVDDTGSYTIVVN